MNIENFVRIASRLDWSETENLYRACLDSGDVFDSLDEEEAKERSYKALVRQTLGSLKDDQGNRIFASVKTTDEDGNSIRYYKQERMFDVDDLRYVSDYHFKTSKHHYKEGMRYVKRAKEEFSVQLPIPEFWETEEDAA